MRMLPKPIAGMPGESIFCAAERVIAKSNESGETFLLNFNDTELIVYPGSHRFDIAEKWAMAREIASMRKQGE